MPIMMNSDLSVDRRKLCFVAGAYLALCHDMIDSGDPQMVMIGTMSKRCVEAALADVNTIVLDPEIDEVEDAYQADLFYRVRGLIEGTTEL